MEGRMERRDEASPVEDAGGEEMRAPEEVAVMLRLRALGWGAKRIAAELGCSRNTVGRHLRRGGRAPPRRLGDGAPWTAWGRGPASACGVTAATPTWSARSC